MELALLLARLLLAAVFLLAGVAKIGDAKGSIQALKDFGIPARIAPVLSLSLLAAEIAAGVCLIPMDLAWYGAWGALALFSIFLIAIGIAMARGRNPECHCFGKLHSAPIGWQIVIRNGVLAALAGWLVLRGPSRVGPSVWTHVASAGENERKLFILAGCVMCFLFFRALRGRPSVEAAVAEEPETPELETPDADAQLETEPEASPKPAPPLPVTRQSKPRDPELQRMIDAGKGLPIGVAAPTFALPNIAGQRCSLQSLREDGKILGLVFISPHCDSCRALVPYISRWWREHAQTLTFAIISRGTPAQNLEKLRGLDPARILLQHAFELSDSYGVRSTPAVVLIGTDGRIQSEIVVGRDDIAQLIASLTRPSLPNMNPETKS